MSLSSAINRIERRYAWSLLGFMLAIIFGLFSLYSEFWRDRRPQLTFEIISDASVLDVREKLGNLEIVYDGVDIQKVRKSLRVIVIRVINEGPNDILRAHYDERVPFGFRVIGGTLIRAEVLASSNSYLHDTLTTIREAGNSAVFTPVILEAGEWFTVKSLILHPESAHPNLEPIGKIAGVREIRHINLIESTTEPSFWSRTFSGGPWIQTIRFPAYFFGLIFVIACVGIPIGITSGALGKHRRRQHVKQFKSMTKRQLSEADEYIFERYVEHDLHYLEVLQRAAAREKRLDFEVRRYERHKNRGPEVADMEQMVLTRPNDFPAQGGYPRMPIRDMQDSGFIVKAAQHWTVDPHLKEILEEFLRFVQIKRAS